MGFLQGGPPGAVAGAGLGFLVVLGKAHLMEQERKEYKIFPAQ